MLYNFPRMKPSMHVSDSNLASFLHSGGVCKWHFFYFCGIWLLSNVFYVNKRGIVLCRCACFIVYGFEGPHLIWDALSTLCLISDLVLWNPKFTTVVEGWESVLSVLSVVRNTFVVYNSWRDTYSKNSACQILVGEAFDWHWD